MDENEAELLRQIYTRIGMIMEDVSIVALELGAPATSLEREKIAALSDAVATISSLNAAAGALTKGSR